MPDAELLEEIRRDLDASPFVGEGHRKVWARLRQRDIRTSRKRVLRLTREAGLLAPTPQVRKRSARLHEGTITVSVPDTLWATDATEGARRGPLRGIPDRRPRLERGLVRRRPADGPLRRRRPAARGLRRALRLGRAGRRAGLALRYDGGSCFRSDHYQTEIDHLGIARSPAFHYEPETNGCAEKAIQVLKEQGALDRALRHPRRAPSRRPRLRTDLQPAVADRTPRLPNAERGARPPARPGSRRGMISLSTKVSGEPGPADL
jgi:putative transposase